MVVEGEGEATMTFLQAPRSDGNGLGCSTKSVECVLVRWISVCVCAKGVWGEKGVGV